MHVGESEMGSRDQLEAGSVAAISSSRLDGVLFDLCQDQGKHINMLAR